MVLCFDIGNTEIDVGVFENDTYVKSFSIAYEKEQSCWTYLGSILKTLKANDIKPEDVSGSILCSVVNDSTQGVYEAMEIAFNHKPVMFDNNSAVTGLEIKTDNPDEVGLDIIAGCLAVKENCAMPAIVVDMGTGTTLTAMDKDGSILGVSIVPGILISLQALNARTGLPIDESFTPPAKAIGTNTADSIASGIVLGNAFLMDGMISAFEKEIGADCNVYCTGGGSKYIMPFCQHSYTLNENLLLEGVYLYYKKYKGI